MKISGVTIPPSAARLTESLRDVGYDFKSAVADLVDNSVTAGATAVEVTIEFCGESSRVFITDNGRGMTPSGLNEAMRFGSRRAYGHGDLGRYGLGLKTASLSQGRSLTVVTRHRPNSPSLVRQIDLDIIQEFDEWLVLTPTRSEPANRARDFLGTATGTVVIWEKLDRVLPEKNTTGGWARRRFEILQEKCVEHLSMVFHRFLDDSPQVPQVSISVNGEKLRPWDPFCKHERNSRELDLQRFEVTHGKASGHVSLRRHILPGKNQFSSTEKFDSASGPLKWNRQQGLYIYRANRLVQWGGWAGIRAIDEHTKLARASIDFDTDLDEAFNINVAKMRVSLPAQLKQMLERPVNELCILADDAYRKTSKRQPKIDTDIVTSKPPANASELGLALKSIAAQSGHYDAFKEIAAMLREQMPDVAEALGI